MKKLTTILAIMLFTFSSCEREYTCHCRLLDSSGKQLNSLSYRGTYTESDAKVWCDNYNEESAGFGFSWECTLH